MWCFHWEFVLLLESNLDFNELMYKFCKAVFGFAFSGSPALPLSGYRCLYILALMVDMNTATSTPFALPV